MDRHWQGSSRKNHQIMTAHVPMLVAPQSRRILVVGVGADQTPSRFLMYDVDALHCVDIEPVIFDFIEEHFDSDWMSDSRIERISDDGRNYVAHCDQTCDIISIEVGQLFRPGVSAFYTRDFYEHAAGKLAADGMLVQFAPIAFFTESHFRGVVRTFMEVFPASVLWYNERELLLLDCLTPTFDIDADAMIRGLSNPEIDSDMEYSMWDNRRFPVNRPEMFAGGFLCGPTKLRELAETGRVYDDDLLVLDYATIGITKTVRPTRDRQYGAHPKAS